MNSVISFWKHISWKQWLLPILVIILFKVGFFAFASGFFDTVPFSEGDFYGNYQYRTITPETPGFIQKSVELPFMFSHFDGQWYIQIAEQGYNAKALLEEPRNIVFYPLYPALLAGFNFIVQNTAQASLVLANIFSAMGLLLFWKLSKFELDFNTSLEVSSSKNWFGRTCEAAHPTSDSNRGHSFFCSTFFMPSGEAIRSFSEEWWALAFIVLLPMGVFWQASYTEGLFLLLSVGSIFAARKRNYALSGVLAMLATLTKVQGILLLPVLALEWWLQRKEQKVETPATGKFSWLWFLLIPIALCGFFTYMYVLTGDFWASIEAQKSFGGGRVLGFRPDVLWETFMNLAPGHTYRNSPIDAAFVFGWLLLLGVGIKSVRPTYWLFSLLALLLPLSSWSIMSMGRYSLVAFPLIWIILSWTRRWWFLRIPLLILSGMVMLYFTQQFIHHYWVG